MGSHLYCQAERLTAWIEYCDTMIRQTNAKNKMVALLKKAAWLFIMMLLTVSVDAAKDPLKHGMRLFKKHRYEQAINVLYSQLADSDPNRLDKIHLGLGMSCLANSALYRDLYQAAIAFNQDYLMRLLPVKGPPESHLALLYLGKNHLESGDWVAAVAAFNKFMAVERAEPRETDLARISLATAYYLQGKPDKALALWSQIKTDQPERITSLAASYSQVGLADKQPLAMCRDALQQIRLSGREPSIQIISNLIYVYTRQGMLDEGFELIRQSDLKAFFHQDSPAKNKVIHYYDSALLGNLSLFYSRAAVKFFAKAYSSSNKKVRSLAHYYLAESYGFADSPDQSQQLIQEFISENGNAKRLKTHARIRQAFNKYQLGNPDAAHQQIKALLKSELEPDLIAEILLGCIRYEFEIPQVVMSASAIAGNGQGRAAFKLNYALGKYYLWKKDYSKAILHMEAGRDKSHKNRIEFNDPLMLVNLAEAYYYSKQFSESLEIFFEMSKQFPALRQIQVALQAVYSMEQKSAGDVKIL